MNRFLKKAALWVPQIKKLYREREELYRERDGWVIAAGVYQNQADILSRLHDEVVQRRWEGCMRGGGGYTCLYPFERLEISTDGGARSCCASYLKPGLLFGNAFEQDIESVWNSENAKKLRYSVAKGDFEYCRENCVLWQNRGINPEPVVKRQDSDYENYHQCALNKGPSIIQLTCDLSCNLYCSSCRTAPKALSAEESEKLLEFLNQKIRPLLPNCKELGMLGSGEVFASKACSAFLKTLTAAEFPQLTIHLTTNGQLLTRKRWAEYENLKGIPLTLSVSIDAARRETYELLRRGGKWETLCENMEFCRELREKGETTKFMLNFVVQRDNFREMRDFVALGKRWGADRVTFTHLDQWGTRSDEEYHKLDVFDLSNPCYQEAFDILSDIVHTAVGIEIAHNIPNIGAPC